MSEKSKNIFSKLIDITDKNNANIYIDFVSHKDVQLAVIQKESKSAEINDEDNKALTLLLSDIQSQCKQYGIPLNRVQGNPENKQTVTAGLKTDKASLSDAEVALQKMQLRAQELGAELVLSDRPAMMAEEPWRLPEVSYPESRSADLPVAEGLAKLAVAIQAVADKCPLQMSLMIRPDLRPQVILKVSAGEVNWIFAAKEGRYPLKDVLAKMAGKATTHGWDAVVVYQRGQANMLLKQQHIKRFITGNVLAPLNEDIESSDATRLQTHNLTLSAPHLSFGGAGTGDSMAQVGWDFIKGMIVFKQEADDGSYRVKKIEKITPLNSPYIGMKVPLSRAPGSVNDIGEVQFDIKEGDHFTNNLVVNGIEQDTISSFFKRHFEATPAEQRIYHLGKFDNFKNEQFQPEDFVIRTMGAPNTESRGSQDEGDGAVVLFVQMKGSDSEPGRTEVDWLLTDDYNSALVVSNYQLLDKMLRKPSEMTLGYNVGFGSYSADKGKSGKIEAIRGQLTDTFEESLIAPDSTGSMVVHVTLNFYCYVVLADNKSASIPFTMRSSYSDDERSDICIEYKFDGDIGGKYYDKDFPAVSYNYSYIPYGNSSDPDTVQSGGTGFLHINLKSNYSAVVNDDIISFVYQPELSSFTASTDKYKCTSSCQKADKTGVEIYRNKFQPKFESQLFEKIKSRAINIKLNDINTFILRNLLFPADNYFRVQYARVPGDLLVMGKLGAGSESFSVIPGETTIVAGSVCQFKTTPDVQGVKWSISDSEKGNTGADLGTIDAATGKYTAPQAAAVTEGVRHVVICAEKGDTKVYALASVLAHSVNISPAYQVILPGKSSSLTAQSLNGGELTWTLADNPQGSTLTKVSNNEYTYKAGKKNKKLKLNLERISVTDETGTTTEAMILVRNVLLTGYIRVSYDNMPDNSVQLTYFPDPDDAESAIPAEDTVWTVLESGGATLDHETGILSCGEATDNGFAVISTKYLDEDEGALNCVIAIPLPLNTYKETILASYSADQ